MNILTVLNQSITFGLDYNNHSYFQQPYPEIRETYVGRGTMTVTPALCMPLSTAGTALQSWHAVVLVQET